MDYSQMLNTEEWKKKRIKIITRDGNKCQRCGFDAIEKKPLSSIGKLSLQVDVEKTSHNLHGQVNIVRFYSSNYNEWVYCKALKGLQQSFEPNQWVIVINFIKKELSTDRFNGATIDNLGEIFFKDPEINVNLIKNIKRAEGEIDFNQFDIDREAFYLTSEDNKGELLKSDHLHVHHKCYRKKIKIWDQPDEEYITLCNVCHRIVHENQLIPFYNEKGDIIQDMIPCWKCGGLGYLDCYSHVDGGICYACSGYGYQQSIQVFN